jgi:hypothetical protein
VLFISSLSLSPTLKAKAKACLIQTQKMMQYLGHFYDAFALNKSSA